MTSWSAIVRPEVEVFRRWASGLAYVPRAWRPWRFHDGRVEEWGGPAGERAIWSELTWLGRTTLVLQCHDEHLAARHGLPVGFVLRDLTSIYSAGWASASAHARLDLLFDVAALAQGSTDCATNQTALEVFTKALADAEPVVRLAAVRCARVLEPRAAANLLAGVYDDENPGVEMWAEHYRHMAARGPTGKQ